MDLDFWMKRAPILLLAACSAMPVPPPPPHPPPSATPPPSAPPAATAPPPTDTAAPAPDTVTEPGALLEETVLGGEASINGASLAIDAHGRLFLTGGFTGTATFGDLPPLVSQKPDAFVLSLDADRKPLWAHRIGGDGYDYGGDVVVDAANNVYVSGAFESKSIDLGKGPLKNAGVHDLYLAKYDERGTLLWAKRYGDFQDQIDMHLALVPSGGVVATGWFNGTIDFGAGPVRSPWGKASFVARIDENGKGLWSSWFGHRIDFAGTDSAVDASGTIFVSGASEGTADFVAGGKPAKNNDLGPVLLSFDDKGKKLSAHRYGSGADNMTTAVAIGKNHDVRLVTVSRGTVDFGDGAHTPKGEQAVYLTAWDAKGALLYSHEIASFAMASVYVARIDDDDNLVVIGQFSDGGFGGGSAGYAIKVDATGHTLWKRSVFRGGQTFLTGLAFTKGKVLVAGAVAAQRVAMMKNGLYLATIAP